MSKFSAFAKISLSIITANLISITQVKAQSYLGFSFGASASSVSSDISNASYTKVSPNFGYEFSLLFNHLLNKRLSLNLSTVFIQKNYSFDRTGGYTGVYESKSNNYVHFPVSIGVRILMKKKIDIQIIGGGYVGYWLNGLIKGKSIDVFSVKDSILSNGTRLETFNLVEYSGKYNFNPQTDRRLEAGIVIGSEFFYILENKNRISFSLIYYHSITDQQKNTLIHQSIYNRTLSIKIGYCFLTKSVWRK